MLSPGHFAVLSSPSVCYSPSNLGIRNFITDLRRNEAATQGAKSEVVGCSSFTQRSLWTLKCLGLTKYLSGMDRCFTIEQKQLLGPQSENCCSLHRLQSFYASASREPSGYFPSFLSYLANFLQSSGVFF